MSVSDLPFGNFAIFGDIAFHGTFNNDTFKWLFPKKAKGKMTALNKRQTKKCLRRKHETNKFPNSKSSFETNTLNKYSVKPKK